MKTKYSYKQIGTITFPILISLIMEQMIGMTDTAFLGRVGEIELGASAIAGVYYLAIFMMAFGFSIGAQILIARRNGEGNYKEIGPIFYQGIYFLLAMAVIYLKEYHFVSSHLRCSRKLYSLACVRVLLFFCHGHVPRLLCRYDTNQNTDAELYRNGAFERGIQLYPDIRKIRLPATGNRRCCHRFVTGRNGIGDFLHHLYMETN